MTSQKNPTPWNVLQKSDHDHHTTWIVDANGERVLPWMAFDEMKKTPARALARRIVYAINELST
jgi:hypothetical protein